jgi:hypothetical protein
MKFGKRGVEAATFFWMKLGKRGAEAAAAEAAAAAAEAAAAAVASLVPGAGRGSTSAAQNSASC